MGHSKEIITMDVYGDNKGIIVEGIPEIEEFMQDILPDVQTRRENDQTDVLPDIDKYLEQSEWVALFYNTPFIFSIYTDGC